MFIIGMRPYAGLFTKQQFQRGAIPNPGTRGSVTDPNTGATKEFISVKLGAATWLNGIAVILDGGAAPGSAVTTASGAPASSRQDRLGILAFASATATQTMAGTAYGWAQIYGEVAAYVSASVSSPGIQLAIGASGQLIAAVAQTSASAQTLGISLATATAAAGGLSKVFLTYPRFSGFPDANLS